MIQIVISTLRFIHHWRAVCRSVGWILAVLVVYRRRAYFDLALALLEYFVRSHGRKWNEEYGY